MPVNKLSTCVLFICLLVCFNVLFVLLYYFAVFFGGNQDTGRKHMMISYQWNHQNLVKELYAKFKALDIPLCTSSHRIYAFNKKNFMLC